MPTITFQQALKQARRNVFVHPNAWHVAILCGSIPQIRFAFNEARLILAASSLKVERVLHTEMRIETERGGSFYFIDPIGNENDIPGRAFTHLMWLFDAGIKPGTEERVRATLRSPAVPPEMLLEHHCTL